MVGAIVVGGATVVGATLVAAPAVVVNATVVVGPAAVVEDGCGFGEVVADGTTVGVGPAVTGFFCEVAEPMAPRTTTTAIVSTHHRRHHGRPDDNVAGPAWIGGDVGPGGEKLVASRYGPKALRVMMLTHRSTATAGSDCGLRPG